MQTAGEAARSIEEALRGQRALEAARAAAAALQRFPREAPLHVLMARCAQALGDFRTMLAAAEAALSLHDAPAHRLLRCEALLLCGDKATALAALAREQSQADGDPGRLQRIAELYGQSARHDAALGCYRRAVALAPDDLDARYSLAASLVANGELEAGEQCYLDVLAERADDADAWYNLATVRRQTSDRNHLELLHKQLARLPARASAEVPLCYAIAKEYEDLGDHPRAFAFLSRGASARRRRLGYRVESDLEAMNCLRETFTHAMFVDAPPVSVARGPIFVTGLPRSGTTLVDRILAAHPAVASLGEINDFALALINTLGRARDKCETIRRSAEVDFAALGRRYLEATRGYGFAQPYLIDKTPLNFLYLGLIRLALPEARVIHIRREPADACFAMYKTLFRMGYPFSYDLEDLGRHHNGYSALMDHWRAVMPGFVHEIRYEDLVADQHGSTRALLAFCGLDWDDNCMRFHEAPGAAATASAAQVRQPIYSSSVGRWREYADQLEPLLAVLGRSDGVARP